MAGRSRARSRVGLTNRKDLLTNREEEVASPAAVEKEGNGGPSRAGGSRSKSAEPYISWSEAQAKLINERAEALLREGRDKVSTRPQQNSGNRLRMAQRKDLMARLEKAAPRMIDLFRSIGQPLDL